VGSACLECYGEGAGAPVCPVVVCWCAGVLVCWCAGVLVCWCARVLGPLSGGELECWNGEMPENQSTACCNAAFS
jgi:hypothetical protein